MPPGPPPKGKTYLSIYLRQSYRNGPHVRKRNIANLTHCDPQEIAAIELALRFKGYLAVLGSVDQIRLSQGLSAGAVARHLAEAAFHVLSRQQVYQDPTVRPGRTREV